MKETKDDKKLQNKKEEGKKTTKGKHKEEPTLGDIVFRVLVIVVIFFIAVIAYASYIQGIKSDDNVNDSSSSNIIRTIEKTN